MRSAAQSGDPVVVASRRRSKPRRPTGCFVVILGDDGSGKSTLMNSLRSSRAAWRYVSADPRDLFPTPGLEFMNWTLRHHPREYLQVLRPYSRASLLLSILMLQFEYFIRPALVAGRVVVCDSYYFRFLAKERLLNPAGASVLEALRRLLPKPDLVVTLDVPEKECFRRKLKRLSTFEHIGPSSLSGFIALQVAVRRELSVLLRGITHATLDGDRPIVVVANESVEIIEGVVSHARS